MNRAQRRAAKTAKGPLEVAARSDKLRAAVVPDPDRPNERCSLADVLGDLLTRGLLPNFTSVYGKPTHDGLGDCHEVATSFMTDLIVGNASDGWRWLTGNLSKPDGERYEHSWLEFDGWALDAANGKCLVMSVPMYRETTKATVTIERNGEQTREWLIDEAERIQR